MTEAIKSGLQETIQDLQSKQESLQTTLRGYREFQQYLTDQLNTIDANGVQPRDILSLDRAVEKALQNRELKHSDRVVMIAKANGGTITAKMAVDVLMRLGVSKAKERNLNSTVHRILNDPDTGHFEPYGPRGQYRLRELPEN